MMKVLLSVLVVVGLTVCPAAATILSKDAAAHVGEASVVRGTVAQVSKVGALTFLNFGQAHPNSEFTVVIRSAPESFGDLTRWQGQEVEVSGTISLFKNRPQIEVTSPSNLRAASSAPEEKAGVGSIAPPRTGVIPPADDSGSAPGVGAINAPDGTSTVEIVRPAFDKKANANLLEGRIKFPRNTFHSSYFAEAQAIAKEENKPIAVLYTDKDSTCGLCRNATNVMADALRSQAIFVYSRNLRRLPERVAQELSARGEFIPKVAVFDAELKECYGMVTYEEVKADGDAAMKELKRKL